MDVENAGRVVLSKGEGEGAATLIHVGRRSRIGRFFAHMRDAWKRDSDKAREERRQVVETARCFHELMKAQGGQEYAASAMKHLRQMTGEDLPLQDRQVEAVSSSLASANGQAIARRRRVLSGREIRKAIRAADQEVRKRQRANESRLHAVTTLDNLAQLLGPNVGEELMMRQFIRNDAAAWVQIASQGHRRTVSQEDIAAHVREGGNALGYRVAEQGSRPPSQTSERVSPIATEVHDGVAETSRRVGAHLPIGVKGSAMQHMHPQDLHRPDHPEQARLHDLHVQARAHAFLIALLQGRSAARQLLDLARAVTGFSAAPLAALTDDFVVNWKRAVFSAFQELDPAQQTLIVNLLQVPGNSFWLLRQGTAQALCQHKSADLVFAGEDLDGTNAANRAASEELTNANRIIKALPAYIGELGMVSPCLVDKCIAEGERVGRDQEMAVAEIERQLRTQCASYRGDSEALKAFKMPLQIMRAEVRTMEQVGGVGRGQCPSAGAQAEKLQELNRFTRVHQRELLGGLAVEQSAMAEVIEGWGEHMGNPGFVAAHRSLNRPELSAFNTIREDFKLVPVSPQSPLPGDELEQEEGERTEHFFRLSGTVDVAPLDPSKRNFEQQLQARLVGRRSYRNVGGHKIDTRVKFKEIESRRIDIITPDGPQQINEDTRVTDRDRYATQLDAACQSNVQLAKNVSSLVSEDVVPKLLSAVASTPVRYDGSDGKQVQVVLQDKNPLTHARMRVQNVDNGKVRIVYELYQQVAELQLLEARQRGKPRVLRRVTFPLEERQGTNLMTTFIIEATDQQLNRGEFKVIQQPKSQLRLATQNPIVT